MSILVLNADRSSSASLTRGDEPAGRGIRLAALRVPLTLKLVGANVAIVAVLLAALAVAGVQVSAAVIAIGLIAIVVHAGLVVVALQPIHELESVARRVFQGDFGARVTRSSVADNEVVRVGSMLNTLLDSLVTDRARMRELARDVIDAGDRERAALARELHDSTAQHVAALLFELSAAARDARDPALGERLTVARDSAQSILEEIQLLSHTVHSAVLDDLGLEAALRRLVRDASNGNAIDFDVQMQLGGPRLPRATESALYRVAREAVFNAARHSGARRVRVSLKQLDQQLVLQVHDDGRGFDVGRAMSAEATSRGLAAMRERLALVDGTLRVDSAANAGTTVTASVPIR